MKKLLKQFGSIIILPLGILFVLGSSNLVALAATNAIETPVALFQTSLASPITAAATTMTLVSGATLDGTTLASSTYSFVIDEGTSAQEFVKADCTNTACTNMQRGLSAITGTSTVAGLAEPHRRAASVKISDAPLLLNLVGILSGISSFPNTLSYTSVNTFASTSEQIPSARFVLGVANVASSSAVKVVQTQNNTFTGTNVFQTGSLTLSNGFTSSAASQINSTLGVSGTTTLTSGALVTTPYRCTTSSDSNQLCEKAYIDGVAVAGAANANDTTKGIVQTATGAQAAAGTSLGSTGARLALGANLATSTSQVAQNSVVVTNTSGKIDPSFLTNTGYTFSDSTTTNATTTNFSVSGVSNVASTSIEVITASSTWTKPANLQFVIVELVGGGGAGGTGTGFSGGSSGCYVRKVISASLLGSTVSVTIGAGGLTSGSAGNNGTSTLFGTFATALPGLGGQSGYGLASGQVCTGGDLNITGTHGNGTTSDSNGGALVIFPAGTAPAPIFGESYGYGGAAGSPGGTGVVVITKVFH